MTLAHGEDKVRKITHKGAEYWVYRFDPDTEKLELWLPPPKPPNQYWASRNKFTSVRQRIEKAGKQMVFAVNGAIYEGSFEPTGLHISEGKTHVALNRKDYVKKSPDEYTPNFYLKPNGVFFQRKNGSFGIMETEEFHQAQIDCLMACQSGPHLLHHPDTPSEKFPQRGIHKELNEPSDSKRSRNGVGITKAGVIYFVCSTNDGPTGRSNLFNFASCFRDKLGCESALYLDGDISYMYIKGHTPVREKDVNAFTGIFAISQ